MTTSRQDTVIAVDVHNVQTHIGLFEGQNLVENWWIETHADETPDVLAADLNGLLVFRGLRIQDVVGSIVSSTVPNLVRSWSEMARKYLSNPMLVIGPGLRTGMPIRIEQAGELGANRLVNAVAAYERVGRATIVVDFATAIAFDVVSDGGEYLGSVFAPGLDISFNKLLSQAAGLPQTPLGQPSAAIGRSTTEALNSGTVYGAAGLCDGIVQRIADEMEKDPAVLATGPRATFVVGFCEKIDVVDKNLTLRGLHIIHERNR
jgi:type III pantothenate kinase